MRNLAFSAALLPLLLVSCSGELPESSTPSDPTPSASTPDVDRNTHHPAVDFAKWSKIFPIETFEKTSGFRRYSTSDRDDPTDLWKSSGEIITSPAHLCEVELTRRRVKAKHDLGRAVPVDTFLWRQGPPDRPYLTKTGGVPHREKSAPWPKAADGTPYTFVAQFCFLDSKDIVSDKLPGDVMLMFFEDAGALYGDPEDVRLEWTAKDLKEPMTARDCPKPGFVVPELAGEIFRCNEYPDADEIFRKEGHDEFYLLAKTQSTKIGRETFFIQGDPRKKGQELFCAFNSIFPKEKWPFTNMENLPKDRKEDKRNYGWGAYEMCFGDAGCVYFMIDGAGKVTWASDCY